MDLIPLGIGFGSGGITIGFLAKWIFVTKGELVAHEKEDRLRSDASVQRVDDKLADIYKGIVATLAQIAADAFAGRISWALSIKSID